MSDISKTKLSLLMDELENNKLVVILQILNCGLDPPKEIKTNGYFYSPFNICRFTSGTDPPDKKQLKNYVQLL